MVALRAAVPRAGGDLSQTAAEAFREAFVSHSADELLPHQSAVKLNLANCTNRPQGVLVVLSHDCGATCSRLCFGVFFSNEFNSNSTVCLALCLQPTA